MASDILDVLNIKEETRIQNQQQKSKQRQRDSENAEFGSMNKKRKGGAMARELYNLIGSNLPPVAVEKTLKFKDKIKSGKASPWVWAPFKSGARNDELTLHHWVKGPISEQDAQIPYSFDKYNTSLDIPTFTEEEYETLLSDLDQDWDYEETRYLFDLANDYDLRWAVIADRYENRSEEKKRTVEDLKERLYSVSAKILNSKTEGPKDVNLIKSLEAFDKNKEVERKQYLNRLIHRAPTEIAEEESLVIEARKFELAAKKMLMERAQLLQLLDSPQSSASIEQYLTSSGLTQLYNSLMTVDKSKKRKPEVPVAPQLGPNAIPHTQQIQQAQAQAQAQAQSRAQKSQVKQGKKVKEVTPVFQKGDVKLQGQTKDPLQPVLQAKTEVQELLESKLSEEDMEVYGLKFHEEKIQPGVYIRSQKLSTFKPSVQSKVVETLNELGIAPKPTLPTYKVCTKFDKLLQSIASLIDLKKQTDKISAEVALIKTQKGLQ